MMRRIANQDEGDVAPSVNKLKYDDDFKLSNKNFETTLSSVLREGQGKTKQEQIRDVQPYPQPYIFARFSKLAYSDDLERREGESDDAYQKRVGIPEGWSLLTMVRNTDTSNGYVGAIFINGDARQMVIAHRGTKPGIGSITTDLDSIYGNNYGAQMNTACTVGYLMATTLKNLYPEGCVKYNIFFTGHSLGAWLAQISTLSLKYLTVVDKKFVKNPDMEAGINAHTVVYESPGCKDMLVRIVNEFDVRYSDNVMDIEKLDITTYLSSPNQVNCTNTHTGKLYRIYPYVSTDSGWFFRYTIASHSIDGILKTFDPKTGFFQKDEQGNYKIKKVVDWPIKRGTLYNPDNEYDDFFKWAKLQNQFTPAEDSSEFKSAVTAAGGYVIRYQTKKYRDDKLSWNVFNRSEVHFLYTYQMLRSLPDYFDPDTLFEEKDKYSEEKLKQITMSKRSVFFEVPAHKRQLIPFVKTLLEVYPNIKTEVKKQLSSPNAWKKVYDTATNQYTKSIQTYVSMIKNRTFPEFEDFLKNSYQNVIQIAARSNTDFVMSRLVKYLEDVNQYDLKVIMDLRDFSTIEKSFKLEDVLQSDSVLDPLVILDCTVDSEHEDRDAIDMLNAFAEFLEDFPKMCKIVLVSRDDTPYKLSKEIGAVGHSKLKDRFISIQHNGIEWADLTLDAQEHVLSLKVINYQGLPEKFSFNGLFKSKERTLSYLDYPTLANVLKNSEIKIGQEIPMSEDIKDTYIQRSFKSLTPEITPLVFKKMQENTIIAITGILEENLTKFTIDSTKVKIIQSREEFQKLARDGTDVHWLTYENGNFTLKDTTALNKIREFLKEGPSYTPRSEDDVLQLFEKEQKMILADKAGMGKSASTTVLSKRLKEISPDKWIIRVNFIDCTRVFKEEQALENAAITDISKFMIEKILPSNTSTAINTALEKRIFEDSLTKYGGLVLFLDGFDEITPDYEIIALQMLNALQQTKIDSLFVTSRRQTKVQLENTLNTLSMSLEPFNHQNQVEFIVKYWEKHLEPKTAPEADLENYAKQIIEALKSVAGDEDNTDFLGVPLQCRLTADYMLDTVKAGETPVIRSGFSLLDLYKTFIAKKLALYREYNRHSNETISSVNQTKIMDILLQDTHYLYALQLLLSEDTYASLNLPHFDGDLKQLLDEEVLKSGLMGYGLNKPHFIHRTVAEYFVFNYTVNLTGSSIPKKLSLEILLRDGLRVVRSFFENQFTVIKQFESFMVSQAPLIVQIYFDTVTENWDNNNKLCLNENGETALQILLREGHEDMSKHLLNLIKTNLDDKTKIAFVNTMDYKNGLTALDYAVKSSYEDIVGDLIAIGAVVKDATGKHWSPLHMAAFANQPKIAEILLRNGAEVDVSFELLKYTPLHLACQNGQPEMVELLLKNNANIEAHDIIGYTPLHHAAVDYKDVQGHVNVIKILIEKGANLGSTDLEGSTPLHIATFDGRLEIIKALVENGADFNLKNLRGDTPLMTANFQGSMTYLIEKGADFTVVNNVGDTVLHEAARHGYADVVRELVAKGVDANIKNQNGETALDVAKKYNRKNVIEILS